MHAFKVSPKPHVRAGSLGLKWTSDVPLLTVELEQALLDAAGYISEGELGEDAFFGTTMFSIPLNKIAGQWRGAFDDDAREDLLEAISFSMRFRIQLMRIARAEINARHPGHYFKTSTCDTNFRFQQPLELCINMNIELPLAETPVAIAGE